MTGPRAGIDGCVAAQSDIHSRRVADPDVHVTNRADVDRVWGRQSDASGIVNGGVIFKVDHRTGSESDVADSVDDADGVQCQYARSDYFKITDVCLHGDIGGKGNLISADQGKPVVG